MIVSHTRLGVFVGIVSMVPWILPIGSLVAQVRVGGTVPPSVKASASKMVDPVTSEQLSNRLREARQEDPIRKLEKTPPPAGDSAKGKQNRDLISESTVLCHGGLMTLVPKRSVLHLPEQFGKRIGVQDGSEFVSWPEFLERNRAWIHAVSVTRERATGKKPFTQEETNALRSSGKLVIATFEGGPMSVLPTAFPGEGNPPPPVEASPGNTPSRPTQPKP